MPAITTMLSATAEGRRVTIGCDAMAELRRLSNGRGLSCPACGNVVVLKAGSVVAAHFAHLPGAVCSHPQSEPETEAHRAGKLLLLRWLSNKLPGARVTVEAPIPATNQRADVLVETDDGLLAIEYQCAEISAREWRRRSLLYRQAGIRDLWLLGIDRLCLRGDRLMAGELERAMRADGAPLLFLDPVGSALGAEVLARFRPVGPGPHPRGRLDAKPLTELPFPWKLLDWPQQAAMRQSAAPRKPCVVARRAFDGDGTVRQYLAFKHRVDPDGLPAFFGLPLPGAQAFDCQPALWQAAIYYRFVHGQVGRKWWLGEVELWARRYLPPGTAAGPAVRKALWGWQDLLSAAGLLSIPTRRGSASVEADFVTLGGIPDAEAARRLAATRRSLLWDRD